MNKFYIDDISKNHAVIYVHRNDEYYYYHLTLDYDFEVIEDDDFMHEFTYKHYHAIINEVKGLDDDANIFELPPHEIAFVKDMIDCDYFYDEFNDLFDNEFVRGRYVGHYYYDY